MDLAVNSKPNSNTMERFDGLIGVDSNPNSNKMKRLEGLVVVHKNSNHPPQNVEWGMLNTLQI